jgi:glycosyltransferase involved in cell wall biosynthesis
MKLKILHVYRTYFPDSVGGVEEVIKQISSCTISHGVESRIFVLSPTPQPKSIIYYESNVVRSKSWLAPASCDVGGLDSLSTFRALVDWCDIVNYHFPWPFADVLHILGRVRKPCIVTYHSDIVRQKFIGFLYGPLMRKMLGSVDAVVASSPIYAQSSNVLLNNVDPSRLHIIPLGVSDYCHVDIGLDLERTILEKFNLEGKKFVLSLGALRYYKGLHTLVEATLNISAVVVIAGSGPEEAVLKSQAAKLGLSNIIFTGQITDEEKITLFRHCSVFALPSHLRSEAFGMVLVEASMFGKPLVCCDIKSGPSYINVNEETGLTVPPETPKEFAKAVKILLNDDLANEYGNAARKRYDEHFSGKSLGAAYVSLYKQVMKN